MGSLSSGEKLIANLVQKNRDLLWRIQQKILKFSGNRKIYSDRSCKKRNLNQLLGGLSDDVQVASKKSRIGRFCSKIRKGKLILEPNKGSSHDTSFHNSEIVSSVVSHKLTANLFDSSEGNSSGLFLNCIRLIYLWVIDLDSSLSFCLRREIVFFIQSQRGFVWDDVACMSVFCNLSTAILPLWFAKIESSLSAGGCSVSLLYLKDISVSSWVFLFVLGGLKFDNWLLSRWWGCMFILNLRLATLRFGFYCLWVADSSSVVVTVFWEIFELIRLLWYHNRVLLSITRFFAHSLKDRLILFFTLHFLSTTPSSPFGLCTGFLHRRYRLNSRWNYSAPGTLGVFMLFLVRSKNGENEIWLFFCNCPPFERVQIILAADPVDDRDPLFILQKVKSSNLYWTLAVYCYFCVGWFMLSSGLLMYWIWTFFLGCLLIMGFQIRAFEPISLSWISTSLMTRCIGFQLHDVESDFRVGKKIVAFPSIAILVLLSLGPQSQDAETFQSSNSMKYFYKVLGYPIHKLVFIDSSKDWIWAWFFKEDKVLFVCSSYLIYLDMDLFDHFSRAATLRMVHVLFHGRVLDLYLSHRSGDMRGGEN